MTSLFPIKERIDHDVAESIRLMEIAAKSCQDKKHAQLYLSLANRCQQLLTILHSLENVSVPGETASSIAARLGTTYKIVMQKIYRSQQKGLKVQELWRDEKGLIYPPGLFAGHRLRKRRPNRRQPTFKRRSKGRPKPRQA